MMILSLKEAEIITNRLRDKDLSKTRKIAEMLEKHGIEAVLPGSRESSEGSDFIITLGGDGTILSVAEKAALCGIPVMGINIGNLGYLTDCEFEEAETTIEKVTHGDFTIEKRMMLDVSVPNIGFSARCLNDVCVTRGETAKIIRFGLFINGNFVDNYIADGIIISTPTGATAYNLSAGGPILVPDSEMFAITPICPHMLTSRPVVAASDARIKIVAGETKKGAVVSADGRETVPLEPGDAVYVEKAKIHTDIIKTNKLDFYDILRKKLINS